MPNHWHLLLQPQKDGAMSGYLRWVTATHTMRYHAHNHTSGEVRVYQGRYKSFPVQSNEHFHTVCRYVERNALRAELAERAELWRWVQTIEPEPKLPPPRPMARLPNWVDRVNAAISEQELEAIRRGSPLGDPVWVEATAKRLQLESTLRPRGRPPLPTM